MLQGLARFCFHRRWWIVAAWLIALVGLNAVSSRIGDAFSSSFSLPATESRDVFDILGRSFPGQEGADGQVVVSSDRGVTDPEVQAEVAALLAGIDQVEGVTVTSPYDPATGGTQISQDGTVAFARLALPDPTESDWEATAEEIKDLRAEVDLPGLDVELGGEFFVEFEPPESELFGIVAAIIILLLAFGSVLAMGLPIGVALAGIGTGIALVTIVSHLMAVPDFATNLALMIGLGVGIDYALFIVTRYREGLHAGADAEQSTMVAIDTAGRAVLFAGATVIVSLMGMFLMGVSFVRGLAVGASLTVLMTMIASVTLLPALLGFARDRIDVTTWRALIAVLVFDAGLLAVALGAPQLMLVALGIVVVIMALSFVVPRLRQRVPPRRPRATEEQVAYRWSRLIQDRPWPFFLGGLVVLVLLALPVLSIRLGLSDNGNLPERQTARQAYDTLAEGFGPGFNGPLVMVAETGPDVTDDQLAAVTQAAQQTEGVVFATPPTRSEDGTAARWVAIPASAPQDEATSQLVHRLRDDLEPQTGIDVQVGGQTAVAVDFADYLGARLPLFIGAVLAVSFLLLMVVFRSLLVPLKAVLLNLLSIGAAYGVVVAVFQWGWGADLIGVGKEGPVEAWAPMMLFAIVFGLSMDYEVFLLSRIREEYDRTGDNASAVADGLASTARVITAAAAIMICVFGSFVLEDDRQIKLFGLGLAVAVLIDATIVRMVLVPATMELLGDKNWWLPGWLDRILPKLTVEGPAPTLTTAPPTPEDELVGADR